jgi:hypothetical protein
MQIRDGKAAELRPSKSCPGPGASMSERTSSTACITNGIWQISEGEPGSLTEKDGRGGHEEVESRRFEVSRMKDRVG